MLGKRDGKRSAITVKALGMLVLHCMQMDTAHVPLRHSAQQRSSMGCR